MDKKLKIMVIVAVGALISLFFVWGLSFPGSHGHGRGAMMYDIENVVLVKTFIATLNVILISVLLWNYITVYRDIPTRFTMSLVIVSVALLLYALSSNPLLHSACGFRGVGVGPFTFLSDLFATFAIVILLYQSYE